MSDFNECKTPDMFEPQTPGLPPGAKGGMLAVLGVLIGAAIPYFATPIIAAAERPLVAAVAVVDDNASVDEAVVAEAPEKRWSEKVGLMRAWLPGDRLPYAGTFGTGHDDESVCAPAIAGPLTVGADGAPDALEVAGIVIDTGEPVIDVAANPTHVPDPGTPDPHAADPKVADPKVTDPKANEPKADPHPLARIHIPATTWDGLTNFIEDPSGAMKPFYAQLAKVALKTPNTVVKISHYGDSAIAADGMPSGVRRLLQRTFGDGGHGFSLAAASNNWYRRKDITWDNQGFKTEVFISDDAKDKRYGFAGTAAIGNKGARASWTTVEGPAGTVGTSASRFAVYYLAQAGGGSIALSVDGEEREVVDTASETPEDRVATIEVEDGPHRFELKNVGGGRIKVYGATIERKAGVIYDGLGTIGARDTRWLNFDPEHAKAAIQQRGTDLGVFMYGGNQLEDKVSIARYKESLTQVIGIWRAGLAGKSCLLMSSIDHGEPKRGKIVTVQRLLDIMAAQREVALANGCAWFSLFDAMGGNGAIGEWHKQGLAEGDFAHPTAKGAVVLGQIFFKALMQGFAGYVEAEVKR